MDEEGGVSDGRGVESGYGADAAVVERWGGPRRVGGGAAGPPRVLLEPKIVPARTRELDRARAAKKAAKNARRRPQTLAQASRRRGGRRGAMGGRAGLRLGRGGGRTSLRGKESTVSSKRRLTDAGGVRGERGGL